MCDEQANIDTELVGRIKVSKVAGMAHDVADSNNNKLVGAQFFAEDTKGLFLGTWKNWARWKIDTIGSTG
jgi:hypothetical protein